MVDKITVAYCFDELFSKYAAISTYSLALSNRSDAHVYWCVPQDYMIEARKLLENLKLHKMISVTLIKIETNLFQKWRTSYHLTAANYVRLQLPNVIKEDRIIYLDADTLVTADLAELYSIPLENALIAGCIDPGGERTSKLPRIAADPYINSGVLLMNLGSLRSDDFLAKCIRIYSEYEEQVTWVDQCLINKYAEGRKLVLDDKWNRQVFSRWVQPQAFEEMISPGKSRILHFVGDVKPWQAGSSEAVSQLWKSFAKKLDDRSRDDNA